MILIFNSARSTALPGLALALLGIAAFPGAARADRRAYGETYEAVTAPAGETDVELWYTFAGAPDLVDGPPNRGYRAMVELEHGITDRWDIALYNMVDMFTQNPGYAGIMIESRFRLSLPGEWIVDPVLYVEYARFLFGDATDALELKAIVAKDLGPWNVAVNASIEVERLSTGIYNPEIEYAAGVSREVVSPAFKIGVEAFGKVERPQGQTLAYLWAGPSVSWAMTLERGMRGLWVTLAGGRGLTAESPSFYARGIVGLQF